MSVTVYDCFMHIHPVKGIPPNGEPNSEILKVLQLMVGTDPEE